MNKPKEKKLYKKLIPAVASLAVAATLVIYPMVNNRNGAINPNPGVIINPTNVILTELKAGVHSNTVDLQYGKLIFNDNYEAPQRLKLSLESMDEKSYSLNEMFKYLGHEVKPENLPDDLVPQVNDKYFIFYNKDGSVGYDRFTLTYEQKIDEAYSPLQRQLRIELAKANNLTDLYYTSNQQEEESIINGHKVVVGYRKMSYGPYKNPDGYYDLYVAKFQYKGVYYRVISKNLSQEEFINSITSLLKESNQTSIATPDKIVITEDEGQIAGAKLYFDPAKTTNVQLSYNQLVEYLGKNPKPSYVPEGFTENENNYFSMIKNNDGTVAYDNNSFSYNSSDKSASIMVSIAKGKLPVKCVLYATDEDKNSIINGVKVLLSKSDDIYSINKTENKHGMYFAKFIYDGIGYDIEFTNVPQEEVIKVVKSIIQ